MATILYKRRQPSGLTPLDFTSGSVLVLKSTNFSVPRSLFAGDVSRKKIQLDLYNENGDILLSITFDTGMSGKHHEIRCNNRALTSFGDGWGKAQKVDASYVDFEGWKKSGVTISVHHYSTDSEFGRFQILLGDVTICNFDQAFRGPVTQISYTGNLSLGPDSWTFSVFRVSDLHPRERQFIAPQRLPSPKIPALDSMAISIKSQKNTSISWNNGKEIRVYYLSPGNVLHESAYSKSRWYKGDLDKCHVVLDPTSSFAAIQLPNDEIYIYYQDTKTDFIRQLYQHDSYYSHNRPLTWSEKPLPIAKAVKGSSIAVIQRPSTTGRQASCVFYQDPELHLRARYYDKLGPKWVLGRFNPGVQPRGTPITAEVVHGGDVDIMINVTWRDSRGRVATGSWSGSSGWDLPNSRGGRAALDGSD